MFASPLGSIDVKRLDIINVQFCAYDNYVATYALRSLVIAIKELFPPYVSSVIKKAILKLLEVKPV